jgi:molybdopterin molybdotransferase
VSALSLAKAVETAVTSAAPVTSKETLLINRAQGRILARDIVARKNLPSFDNSAMDGFAFRGEDAGKRLRIKRTIFAGDIAKAELNEGECYRIMTGAQIPSDADTVAPLETCENITETEVTLPKNITPGSNVRKKGEEVECGDVLLREGHRLTYGDIALLSAQGILAVEVYALPSIAVVSTGNEIKEPWQEASEDEIYNANAFGIKALLEHFGFTPHYVGAIPDDKEATVRFIASLKHYDVVLTTGGISKGDADYLYDAFIANGLEVWFHGVNLKPGKGVTFGKMDKTYVMAMPGNPLATMLTSFTFAVPTLFKIAGANACHHTFTYAEFSHDLRFKPGRTDIVLGILENGVFIPTRNNKIGSGMLTPLSESNAVAYIGEGYGTVEREDIVKVVLLNDTTRSETFRALNER